MELISLHIPKTAGTSFRNILKSVYGEDQVTRLDINKLGEVRLDEVLYYENSLPDSRVIHGHIILEVLKNKFTIPEDCKMITWVRDPVKRVISNFYYLESRIRELLSKEDQNLKILLRMQKTLIEFARCDYNRNRQARFLLGGNLEDLDFIGIHEYFNKDIVHLASLLKWKEIPEILHHNKTPDVQSEITKDILEEIRELNMEDVKIYNEALRIRKII